MPRRPVVIYGFQHHSIVVDDRKRSIIAWQNRIGDPSLTILLILELCTIIFSAKAARPKVKAVAESVDLVPHLRALIVTARQLGIGVFYVPHRRWREGDYDGWRYPNPSQIASDRSADFAEGTWGGEWHPDLVPTAGDIIVKEHWGQNADTDLDFQLKQRGIEKIIVVGTAANTCVEATTRCGAELGYHVTLVPDATAAFSPEAMHAAHAINGPTFAHANLTTDTLIAELLKEQGTEAHG